VAEETPTCWSDRENVLRSGAWLDMEWGRFEQLQVL
jgi:hypothetical protein